MYQHEIIMINNLKLTFLSISKLQILKYTIHLTVKEML